MAGAITIATTGLSASQKQMDVIGNNLANSSTLGFKAGNTYFAAVLNQSLAGSGELTVGQGVEVSSIATQFSQGSFETTSNATDMAIDGEGFFMVQDKDGAIYYTRAGNFHVDRDSYLVDANGYKVIGFNVSAESSNASIVQQLEPIRLGNASSEPNATEIISVGVNLDSTEDYGQSFNVSQNVFDSLGGLNSLSINFLKTEVPNTWGFEAALTTAQGVTLLSDTDDMAACGLIFDASGNVESMYKGNVGTLAGVGATAGTAGAVTITNAAAVTANTTTGIVFTKSTTSGLWNLTTADGYASAEATDAGGVMSVDLNGDGSADLSIPLNNTWVAGDTLTLSLTTGAPPSGSAAAGTSGNGAIASTTVNKPGQLYQSTAGAGMTFTKMAATGVWNLTNVDSYANATASQATVNGVDYLYVDLDGKGGTDITIELAGTWVAGNTITIPIATDTYPPTDILLSFGDLANGANIGTVDSSGATVKNMISWNAAGDDANEITGYASTSIVKSLTSDGWAVGVLKSLDIEGNGKIYGVFTNGQTSEMADIMLASFPDSSALKKIGNYFAETNASGTPTRNEPGSGGLGEVLANSLEISNTDTAKEFVNMITAQRAYQANARVITTANDMLTELMNIKR